ncbi:MAG TPA: hypothetical protein VMK83_10860 [Gaiellaceae bacterium]|nr:hypothetical protein [Gaiellaceae bacterium]
MVTASAGGRKTAVSDYAVAAVAASARSKTSSPSRASTRTVSPRLEPPLEQFEREWVFHQPLDRRLQRPCAVGRIPALLGEELLRFIRDLERELALRKPLQNLGTNADRPSLFGRAFDGPMPGHNPFMPVHYDLHVWVAEHNPSGVFALFNPALSCS